MGNCVRATATANRKSKSLNNLQESSLESTNVSHLGFKTAIDAEKYAI